MTPIDHVILASAGLEASAARLRSEHGLASASPGTFAELGLANLLVPFDDDSYVELLAIADREVALANPLGQVLSHATAHGDRLLAWCLAAPIDETASRLDLDPMPLSAVMADGNRRTWRLLGTAEAMSEMTLPFFIEWDDPAAQRDRLAAARDEAPHSRPFTGITAIEVSGDEGHLRDWLGPLDPPVTVVAGEPAVRSIAIGAADGEPIRLY